MTSIKNDAMTVGTAAVSAGLADAIVRNAQIKKAMKPVGEAIKNAAGKTVTKDTYVNAGKTVGAAAKKAVNKETYKGAGKAVKDAATATGKAIKDVAKKAVKTDTYKNLGKAFKKAFSKESFDGIKKFISKQSNAILKDVKKYVKASNWKTAGKVAVVAGVIAAGIVAVKNIFSKDAE